jgi:hypothetical protein
MTFMLRSELFYAILVFLALTVAGTAVRCQTAAQPPLASETPPLGDHSWLRGRPTPEQSLSQQLLSGQQTPQQPLSDVLHETNFCSDLIQESGLDENLFHVPQYQTCVYKSQREPLPNRCERPGDTGQATQQTFPPFHATEQTYQRCLEEYKASIRCDFNAACYAEAKEKFLEPLLQQSRYVSYYAAVAMLLISTLFWANSFLAGLVTANFLAGGLGALAAPYVQQARVSAYDPVWDGSLGERVTLAFHGALIGVLLLWGLWIGVLLLDRFGPGWLLERIWSGCAWLNVGQWNGDLTPKQEPPHIGDSTVPILQRLDRSIIRYESVLIRFQVAAAGMTAAFVALILTTDPFWDAVWQAWHEGPWWLFLIELIIGGCIGAFVVDPTMEFVWSGLAERAFEAGKSREIAERQELRLTAGRFCANVVLTAFILPLSHLFIDCCVKALPHFSDIQDWLLLVGIVPLAGFTAWYVCAAAQLGGGRYWHKAGGAITTIYAIFALPQVFQWFAKFIDSAHWAWGGGQAFMALVVICVVAMFVSGAIGFLLGGLPVWIVRLACELAGLRKRVIWFFATYVVFGLLLAAALSFAKLSGEAGMLTNVSWQTVTLLFLLWSIVMAVGPFRRYLNSPADPQAHRPLPSQTTRPF